MKVKGFFFKFSTQVRTRYIEFNSLTKVSLADCPLDHGELECGPQEEEEGEKPVDAQRLLAGDCIKGVAKGVGRETASW